MKVIGLKNKVDLSTVANIKNINNKTEELPIAPDPVIPDMRNITAIPYFSEPILSPTQVKEKRKLIIHIKNYLREFPTCLTEFKDIDYNRKSISHLENYLDEIKMTVCQANSGGLLIGVFQGACDILESTAPMINYNLTGLKYVACNNPNVVNAVKELSLEYQNLNYIPPERRLALLMFQMCYALNSVNKVNNVVEDKMSKLIPEKTVEKYADL